MSSKEQNKQEKRLNSFSKQQIHTVFTKSVKSAPEIAQYLPEYPELFVEERLAPQDAGSNQPVDSNDVFVPNVPVYQNKYQERNVKKVTVVSKSPFTSSKMVEDPTKKVWQYIDDKQQIKGPFSSVEMDEKYDKKFIGNPLKIRCNESQEFTRLVDLFGKVEELPVARTGNQERFDPNNNKKGETNVNIWEKIKPGNGNPENKPQNQSGTQAKTAEDINPNDSKSKQANNTNLSAHPQEETKANELISGIKHSQSDPIKTSQNTEKQAQNNKNAEENKIEKIEDKNQKISTNNSTEKSDKDAPTKPETAQEDEKKTTVPTPVVIDWSKEPSLIQTTTTQNSDEGQGEWKISTLGKSKKKKGKKGKGQADEPEEPTKTETENKAIIKQEPKLPEPIQKVEEVIPEVKTPVIEKIPTPEPVIEKPESKVEEVVETIQEPEIPKKTTETQESVKTFAVEKSKNTKPAKKRLITAWVSDDKTEEKNTVIPVTPASDQDFPSLGVPVQPTKSKPNQVPQKSEEKEEKKQDIKPTVSNQKSEPTTKPVETKPSIPVQNLPKTQAKPAPKIKGTDWSNPSPNPKKEQKPKTDDKYEEEFPSL